MKTNSSRVIPAALVFASWLIPVGMVRAAQTLPHDAITSNCVAPPPKGGGLMVVTKVLEAQARMEIVMNLAYTQLPFERGELHAPDDWDSSNPLFQSWLRIKGFTAENCPRWENGDHLRTCFSGAVLFELSDTEFNEFMTDPFDTNSRRFRYSMSPQGKYSSVPGVLIASQGPDRDLDIDISKFSLERQDFGLGADFVNRVYDPTNGIVSNGDILVSGGGGPCKELWGSIYP